MALILLLLPVALQAQITTNPPVPNTATPTQLRSTGPLCIAQPVPGFTRNGFTIDIGIIHNNTCITTPPYVTETYELGLLPAGTYTVRVFNVTDPTNPVLVSTTSFVVAAAVIPTAPALGPMGMIALLTLIVSTALIVLNRVSAL